MAAKRRAQVRGPRPLRADGRSVDQWLTEIATPKTITLFGQEWTFHPPTEALAAAWDDALLDETRGARAALAAVLVDGQEAADAFLAAAAAAVPLGAATEFWQRLSAEVFGLGERSAS